MNNIRAISLDLDDTLWPIWPAIERAEIALDQFLHEHAPLTAARFPLPAMRHLREQVVQSHPELAHDFTAQRKLSLKHAFETSGESDDLIEPAFEAFYAARNAITLYEDCLPALQRLAARYPLIALTNGNADLERIGIGHFFVGCVSAKHVGVAKPHQPIFDHTRAQLGLPAEQILHVGDDPWLDVEGANAAGFRSAWINRTHAVWPEQIMPAHLILRDLVQLADYLEMETA
jgi:putative hydrolase of the HAD superfamily